jgi:hypothetical protein
LFGGNHFSDVLVDAMPPICVNGMISHWPLRDPLFYTGPDHDLKDEAQVELSPEVQGKLLAMMIGGATDEEREAAARAIVAWPPKNYHLRLAEWGVWIDNDGHLALARSIIEEIPPFVHTTGNPASNMMGEYFVYPMAVSKPIVHVSTNMPLAVDLEVQIREGRPWFAYPKPDDFSIGDQPTGHAEPLDFSGGMIQVQRSGKNNDLELMHVAPQTSVPLQSPLPLQGPQVIGCFRNMLTRYGLTGPEADGLIRVWTPQFFQTEGRRFILRMSPQEYDRQCPMQVRPTPTEVVRLGLVLTEFDPKPATQPVQAP